MIGFRNRKKNDAASKKFSSGNNSHSTQYNEHNEVNLSDLIESTNELAGNIFNYASKKVNLTKENLKQSWNSWNEKQNQARRERAEYERKEREKYEREEYERHEREERERREKNRRERSEYERKEREKYDREERERREQEKREGREQTEREKSERSTNDNQRGMNEEEQKISEREKREKIKKFRELDKKFIKRYMYDDFYNYKKTEKSPSSDSLFLFDFLKVVMVIVIMMTILSFMP